MRGSQGIAFSDLSRSPIEERDIVAVLARDGVVLFSRGSRGRISDFLRGLTELRGHPHGNWCGETVIEPRPTLALPGGAGFSHLALSPHTDRALTPRPPAVVALLIEHAAQHGGHSLFADARTLLLAMGPDFSSLALDAGGAGRYPVFEAHEGFGQIRFRDDELARPRAAVANGRAALAALRTLTSSAIAVTLAAGEGYLVHNHRVLHGRTAFRGYRRATRLLADIRSGSPYAWMNHGFRLSDQLQGDDQWRHDRV